MSNLFHELLAIPRTGIIAFINDSSKEVYLCQGSNLPLLLSRVLNEVRNGTHRYIEDPSSFSMEVLSPIGSRIERLIETSYWEDHYRNSGYKILNPHIYIKLTPRLKLHNTGKLILVELVNRRYGCITVGVFNKKDLAEQFLLEAYGDSNPYRFLVYANNQYTKDYIETVNRENVRIRW